MFIRFVIAGADEDSRWPQGLFQAVGDLRDQGVLAAYERQAADSVFQWFNQNLPVPKRFSRSKKRRAQKTAISWFRDTAHDHIRHMQDLAAILRVHDVSVTLLTTERPGYVIYEDEFQIVAEPFTEGQ